MPTITADDFEKNLLETLEEVRKNIPKLFVNLVLLGNISEVSDLKQLAILAGIKVMQICVLRCTNCR